ncbi:MAG: SUMF1/EgtB/PvdO family nonheme iron enzyme [Deltaproteobacteria bacterium]|nr:SUMF1/EgtB/PvdO family nonheme iron enzyme [Deltaproteobacteria bacterium]
MTFSKRLFAPARLARFGPLWAAALLATSGCVPGATDVPDWNKGSVGGGGAVCGNGSCEAGETENSCSVDCTGVSAECGNGKCEPGESATTCKTDCAVGGKVCGDGTCEGEETFVSCPSDCKPKCKDPIVDCGEHANSCKKYVCGQNGECEEAKLDDNTPCDDGNKCTTEERCENGECKGGKEPDCDDGDACTADDCDAANGTCTNVAVADGTTCPAGGPCEGNNQCQAGQCKPTVWKCECDASKPNDDAQYGCAKKSPANKCNGVSTCVINDDSKKHECVIPESTKVTCDSSLDTDCSTHVCNPQKGACEFKAKPNNTLCDDGSNCTSGDTCFGGECIPGTMICECDIVNFKSQCEKKYQGTAGPCSGQFYCANPAAGPYAAGATSEEKAAKTHCEINPATVINCESKDDTACSVNTCVVDGNDGGCKMVPEKVGKLCDDGAECTPNSACNAAGLCSPALSDSPPCDEKGQCSKAGTVCQDGFCVTNTCVCQEDADCAAKDDGDLCNGTMFCNQATGACELNKATIVNCASLSDTACVVNICYPKLGVCKLTPRENVFKETITDPKTQAVKVSVKPYPVKKVDVFCDDGNTCTPVDECDKGVCVSDDTNTCGCQKDSDCAGQEDGNVCNGTMYCDKLASGGPKCKVNPATVVTCIGVDDTVCAQNVCDPKTGSCKVTPVKGTVLCDDGNPCTPNDFCNAKGQCSPVGADAKACGAGGSCPIGYSCFDGKCATNVCQCSQDSDCASKEDGNVCNGTLYCDKATGACKVNPATIVSCSDTEDSTCLANQCNKATGACAMTPINNNKLCDDGNPCSATPICENGVCKAETEICVCTTDADCAPLQSKNLCAGTLYCKKGATAEQNTCAVNPGSVTVCPSGDDTACMRNQCDAKTGKCAMVNKPDNVVLCDDGNPCTSGDSCVAGACAAGTNICECATDADCASKDDGNACNGTLFCDKTGATNVCKTKPGSIPTCNPTATGSCLVEKCIPATGKCEKISASICNDGNSCTVDYCDLGTDKCAVKSVPDGSGCASLGNSGVCVATSASASDCSVQPQAEMVFVPKGDFQQGCSATEGGACQAAELPQHEVKLSGHWMDRFEVSVARYSACVVAGVCKAPAMTGTSCNYGDTSKLQQPVNCVSHAEAVAYCTWYGENSAAGKKTGRLPTEAEWERAARGGCENFSDCKTETSTYVWGDAPTPSCAMAIMNDGGGKGCDGTAPADIASKPDTDRSVYDVYDLAGNLSEWVQDTFSASYYGTLANPATDPVNSAAGSTKTVRGGSYASTKATDLRAAARASASAASASIGFRCVIVP